MKNNFKYIYIPIILTAFTACTLFKYDNYDGPQETLYGKITDKSGKPVLTDQGSEGIRIHLVERSWSPDANPLDFYAKADGSYRNTKLFKGDYNIRVDGPFVPIVLEDAVSGKTVEDNSVNIHLEGEKELDFHVDPFLNVELLNVSSVNGKLSAKVKVTRGISRDDFKAAISRTGDYKDSYADITDIQLFIGYSPHMGYRNRDSRWSSALNYSGNSFEADLGNPVVINSSGAIPSGRKVFVRAAARINYDTPRGSGIRRWNYSPIEEITVF